jgi:thiamine-monophosphate kinase
VPKLHELGEAEVLRRLTAERARGLGVAVGPGDDAAVLEPEAGRQLVATTDAFVEGAHFLPSWGTPADWGARLAAANLSDLAAMAATPRWALLSMGLRSEHEVDSLLELQSGVVRALGAHGAVVVGGNLVAVQGEEWFDLTLLGEVRTGAAWTRRGAQPGDLLFVTGAPGRAGAGLRIARALGEQAREAEWRPLLEAWLAPAPRIAAALALAATSGVRAAIDLSDGLPGDLAHLCEASAVGAVVDLAACVDPMLERAAGALNTSAESLRLSPSDDYELLLAVDPAARAGCESAAEAVATPFTCIGRFTEAERGITLAPSGRGIDAAGFDHFRRAGRT